jgi:hypothetical protein
VLYLGDHLAPEQLPSLYRAADVLVAPYRGEGFCLPVLEAMACGVPAIHTGIGPTNEFCGPEGGWAVDARRAPVTIPIGVDNLSGPGYVHEVDGEALVRTLRSVAADPGARARRGSAAAEAALKYPWERAAAEVERVFSELESEALPLARDVVPVVLETRSASALLAPGDWSDESSWSPVLDAWVRATGPDADATLVLAVPVADAEAVAGRVVARLAELGHADDALPDLLAHPIGDSPLELAGLVAAVDAVIAEADGPPSLVRRARRVVAPGEVADFAAALPRLSPVA